MEMEIVCLVGRRVRRLREMKGLTQQELGENADISYKYLGAIERGEENPSLRVLAQLANALGVEPGDLFEARHEETSPTKLRRELNGLLKEADTATLQQAVKLLRALLR